jgi:hypothetical protein
MILQSTIHDLLEVEVFDERFDFRVVQGLGEEWVAQKRAEFSLAGKSLEFGILNDDGAGDGLAGAGIDYGLKR